LIRASIATPASIVIDVDQVSTGRIAQLLLSSNLC
jgi:hypothetical protein